MLRHHRILLIASLTAVAFATLATVAVARLTFDSTIRLYDSFPAFHGKVNSDGGDFCIQNRKVKLFKQRHGDDQLLGRDHTNDRGRYRINYDPTSGAYYSRVKELSSASLNVTCRRDKSNVVVVD